MEKRMSKIAILFILILSISAFTSCVIIDPGDNVDNTNYSASEPFAYEVKVKSQDQFVLEGINGEIEVIGVENAASVQITGERIVRSDSDKDANACLNELEVQLIESNDEVYVKSVQPKESRGRQYIVNYHITVPNDWNVTVGHVNGNIEIKILVSDVSIGSVNGNVELEAIAGNVSVVLTNGNIKAEITLPLQGKCSLHTVNGLIGAEIPKNTSAEFSASVVNGTVSVNGLTLTNMQSSRQSTSGILGTGQGKITLVTVNGTIDVSGY